ncbi:MAG: pyruvate dehydrogenase E2 component (dihydrolipoamide acetyltransferase), partial [Limisphaerales bacterium]
VAAREVPVVNADSVPSTPIGPQETQPSAPLKAASSQVYAGPATRRLARELGVDLSQVEGSGQRKRIVKDDVKAFVKNQLTQKASVTGVGLPAVASIDFAKFGEVELVKLSRIRQRGADNLHRSWVNLPHVTQHDEADISDLEDFRKALKSQAEERGVRLTPLAFIVKTVCKALQEHPEFNSSLHDDRQHLVVKNYINIGMAVDTPEGLVVPVIRGADSKDIWTLCEDIASLSEKARTKKLGLDDLSGGTFTISSLGSLGGTGFTPIVNAPEVAILGVAKMAIKPVWRDESFEPRKMLPLSLSYDHRVINGADGGRFMQRLTQLLGDIRHLAL